MRCRRSLEIANRLWCAAWPGKKLWPKKEETVVGRIDKDQWAHWNEWKELTYLQLSGNASYFRFSRRVTSCFQYQNLPAGHFAQSIGHHRTSWTSTDYDEIVRFPYEAEIRIKPQHKLTLHFFPLFALISTVWRWFRTTRPHIGRWNSCLDGEYCLKKWRVQRWA